MKIIRSLAMAFALACSYLTCADAAEALPEPQLNTQLSPNGKYISFIASQARKKKLFIFDPLSGKRVVAIPLPLRGNVHQYQWTLDSKRIVFLQDKNGDSQFRSYSADLRTGRVQPLTTPDVTVKEVCALSARHHDAVALLIQSTAGLEVIQKNLEDGKTLQTFVSPNGFAWMGCDQALQPVIAVKTGRNGLAEWFVRSESDWSSLFSVGHEDFVSTKPVSFPDSESLFFLDSRDRNATRLVKHGRQKKDGEEIFSNANVDISGVLVDPASGRPLAVAFETTFPTWLALDGTLQRDLSEISKVQSDHIVDLQTDLDGRMLLVTFVSSGGDQYRRLYDRQQRRMIWRFREEQRSHQQALLVQGHVVPTRDGLQQTVYVARSADKAGPLPTVVLIHGGPWDRYTFSSANPRNWYVQQGFTVLMPNFRGSTGHGKNFVNAGDGEWGGKMLDDVIDALRWAIDQGMTDASKVAVVGGSYGGYAVQALLGRYPNAFSCGVSIAGPSDLEKFVRRMSLAFPHQSWRLLRAVGDPEAVSDQKKLRGVSPLYTLQQISKPLFLVAGRNDPFVSVDETMEVSSALSKQGVSSPLLVFEEEGHGVSRPENTRLLYASIANFIGSCFGNEITRIPLGKKTQATVSIVNGGGMLGLAR